MIYAALKQSTMFIHYDMKYFYRRNQNNSRYLILLKMLKTQQHS